jgi:hypothetical protein
MPRHPGAAAVGHLAELPPLERQVIRCLRFWCAGPNGQAALGRELAQRMGRRAAERVTAHLDELLQVTASHARRPLMGHDLDCLCAGGDECVFARFVALAAEGAREEAALMASLMVRPDLALCLVRLAEDVGLGLMRGQTPRILN